MQLLIVIRQRRHRHRQLMRIGSHRLQVMLVRKKRIRRTRKLAPSATRIASPHTPATKSYAAAASQTRDPHLRHLAQPLNLLPKLRLRPRIQHIQLQLAQQLSAARVFISLTSASA
jgi:hypothetical protein